MSAEKKLKLIEKLGERFGVDPARLLATLKATAFKQKNGQEITDHQMMSLLVVADQYNLNPFTKEVYAYPDKGGIIPVVGVDGWARIINAHDQFDGMEYIPSEEMVTLDHAKPAPVSLTCVVYRKDRNHPVSVTEYLDEVYRTPFVRSGRAIPGPWQTHPKRMLRHKATIQACRLAFGLVGIHDQDEAERIVESHADLESDRIERQYPDVKVATVDGKKVTEEEQKRDQTPAAGVDEAGGECESTSTLSSTEPPADQDVPEKVVEFATAVVARVSHTGAWNAGRDLARERLQGADLDYVLAAIDTAEKARTKPTASGEQAA